MAKSAGYVSADYLRKVAALAAGVATQIELDDWTSELTARHESGRFYWSVNLVLVAGVKGE